MNSDLTEYLISLGNLAVMARLYCDEQGTIAQSGILQPDEIEHAQTIEWQVDKLLDIIDAQVSMVSARTPENWEDILKTITKKIKEKQDELGRHKKV